MKIYKGFCASPGLVLGQVSRLEHHVETTTVGPFKPSRELQLLTDAIRTAQDELESMADRAAPSEQAIFQFQSMMLDDEGMMNEVRFCINAGVGAAAAMNQVGQRYADQLANMKDNPYMQLRSVDILDATRRVINIITNRPRMWLALDHPVILAAERLMPTDLFSVPSGMILGIITAEGSGQSHAAIIARAMNIPGIVQVGRDFLDDCDGRTVILDATGGQCTLDPDAAARQQAETRICELQRENEEMGQLHALPNRTKDGQPFELLANCFGPEDIDTAMQSGAQGVGLLRTGYMMLPGRILDEQEQYFFYCSCLAAAKGCPVTVRTFDFGSDRTISDAYQGLQSSKLGLAQAVADAAQAELGGLRPLIGIGHGAVGAKVEGAHGHRAAVCGGQTGAIEEILLLLVQNAPGQHHIAAAQQPHALGAGLHGGVDILRAEAIGQQLKGFAVPRFVRQAVQLLHLRVLALELADAGFCLLAGGGVRVQDAVAVGCVQNDGASVAVVQKILAHLHDARDVHCPGNDGGMALAAALGGDDA